LGCKTHCLLRSRFPETWESWNSKVFMVLHKGVEKLVSGFFVYRFRYGPIRVCKVLGEMVDGKLDPKSKAVHRIDFDDTTKCVEPGPIAGQTPRVAAPTGYSASSGSLIDKQKLPAPSGQLGGDAINWSWMLDQVPFPEVDELGTTPAIGDIRAASMPPLACNPPSSSWIKEPEITAVPDGFHFVEGMTLADAYLQGFMQAQYPMDSFHQMGGFC
jgi:hypothetical protein